MSFILLDLIGLFIQSAGVESFLSVRHYQRNRLCRSIVATLAELYLKSFFWSRKVVPGNLSHLTMMVEKKMQILFGGEI